jgi:L-lactate dehydrogenase (cytochrome)
VADYRLAARRRLPRMLFEYIDGGAYQEVTLQRNLRDFEQLSLRQRVMRDMSKLDLSIEAFGQRFAIPLGLSPVGMAGMYARRGEVQAARAAGGAGIPFCLSTVGICSVEEVSQACAAPWFQLYVLRDRGYMRELLQRAYAVGSPVLVLTVDLPVPGARYRDVRSGFRGLSGTAAWLAQAKDGLCHLRWLWDVWLWGRPHKLGSVSGVLKGKQRVSDFLEWIAANFDRSLNWQDLDWIRSQWDRPIVIKGVLDPEDAKLAKAIGADGILVSNHGGRQLDSVRSSISALPGIVDAVGTDVTVFLDGGVRSGLDILKALALGARACFVGRAWAYALGTGGQTAVERLIATFRAELEVAMILTGCASVRACDRGIIDEAYP